MMPAKPPEDFDIESATEVGADKPRGYLVGYPAYFDTGKPTEPPEPEPKTKKQEQTRTTTTQETDASAKPKVEAPKSDNGGN